MNTEPTLVIMAAGMGSRYGGIKQIDPVDSDGHIIIDFSVYDAVKAGFKKIIFIIKHEIEEDFKKAIGDRISQKCEVTYVFQELSKYTTDVPEGRVKPFGTGHAILCCKEYIDGPFAVINADDYYGQNAFRKIYQELTSLDDKAGNSYCMVGYSLKNTVTENGSVSRGVCETDKDNNLISVTERTKIIKDKETGKILFTEDDGKSYEEISGDTIVSMNLWGFRKTIMDELFSEFEKFQREVVPSNPLKSEFFLPSVVQGMLDKNTASVKVLTTDDKWFGVTYKEDKEQVVNAISQLKKDGVYPSNF